MLDARDFVAIIIAALQPNRLEYLIRGRIKLYLLLVSRSGSEIIS